MSMRAILAATLRWHLRKARRSFQLLGRWLTQPARSPTRTVRWG
ncbi:hypothetical protein [Devosia ginsengisoli]|nr:hypothetical protein [Devosia ginsengisoli]MCR6670037.1 hypothetical protein [Devosia ginsengisoli]